MKTFLIPPSPEDRARVIRFLERGSSHLGNTSHYEFLKKMTGLSNSGWTLIIFAVGFGQASITRGHAWAPLLVIVIGLYTLFYSARCGELLDLFHQEHPDNLTMTMAREPEDARKERVEQGNGEGR